MVEHDYGEISYSLMQAEQRTIAQMFEVKRIGGEEANRIFKELSVVLQQVKALKTKVSKAQTAIAYLHLENQQKEDNDNK